MDTPFVIFHPRNLNNMKIDEKPNKFAKIKSCLEMEKNIFLVEIKKNI